MVNRNPRTNWTYEFYRDPAFKKKIADSQRKARARRTPEQRELHNAKIALTYRKNNAWRLGKGKDWVAIAEERLRKALERTV